ncbi:MAG: carboxypeptidase-like regulatory domain-containing protein [Bacteroidota bacterium]
MIKKQKKKAQKAFFSFVPYTVPLFFCQPFGQSGSLALAGLPEKTKFIPVKKYLCISFLLIITCFVAKSQQDFYTIKGVVRDSSLSNHISSASIMCADNSEVAVSDKNGFFKISVTSFPCKLSVSHLGYFNKEIIVSSFSQKAEILLQGKINELPELSVTNVKPLPITKDEPLYITDYEFVNDKILALAYRNKMLSQARLYVLTSEGDTVFSVPVKKPDQLYSDCFDNRYFISKSEAFQLSIDTGNIEFLYPYPSDEFIMLFDLLAEAKADKMYLKKYSLHDQMLEYLEYDKEAKTYSELITVKNENNARMLNDRARIICSSDDPETQARFEDMAFYKPVFAPLININDTLFLFNFEDSWMGFFDDSCKLVKKIPIVFHLDKNWKREIYFDESSGKAYAMFRKSGISTLKEIDIETGELINSVQIPDLPFVDNIKINNGKLYFLYTDHSRSEELRMLYSMKM